MTTSIPTNYQGDKIYHMDKDINHIFSYNNFTPLYDIYQSYLLMNQVISEILAKSLQLGNPRLRSSKYWRQYKYCVL